MNRDQQQRFQLLRAFDIPDDWAAEFATSGAHTVALTELVDLGVAIEYAVALVRNDLDEVRMQLRALPFRDLSERSDEAQVVAAAIEDHWPMPDECCEASRVW